MNEIASLPSVARNDKRKKAARNDELVVCRAY